MINSEMKEKVIGGMLIRLTFDGAFQRSKIYGKNVSSVKRKEFRDYMTTELPNIVLTIQKRKRYTDQDHYKTITRFSYKVTKTFNEILYKKKFRIGNAQKFINLYWKLAWLTKRTSTRPVHCPFDSIIMKKLPKNVRVPWTQFNTIREYQHLVNAAKEIAGKNKSIAEWEMKIYWNVLNGDK
jgi:hypothetical protein